MGRKLESIMELNVVIADDEQLAREQLRRWLTMVPEVNIAAEATDGTSAVNAIEKHRPDLVLLDVQMPGLNGFEVLQRITPEKMPAVIFVTGHNSHAIHAFEAGAIDYLLKPSTRERLSEAIRRVRRRIDAGVGSSQNIRNLIAEWGAPVPRAPRLIVREGERTIFVDTKTIDWIEAAGNYSVVHLGTSKHILRETLGVLESRLSSREFLRVSRSAIINLHKVRELQSVSINSHVVILDSGVKIPLTRSIREIEIKLSTA
ncbi:LytTR family DNA-binding domain-containing protein [soil metagenome]